MNELSILILISTGAGGCLIALSAIIALIASLPARRLSVAKIEALKKASEKWKMSMDSNSRILGKSFNLDLLMCLPDDTDVDAILKMLNSKERMGVE